MDFDINKRTAKCILGGELPCGVVQCYSHRTYVLEVASSIPAPVIVDSSWKIRHTIRLG